MAANISSRHVAASKQTLQTANDPKQLICGREENIKNQNSWAAKKLLITAALHKILAASALN